MSSYFKEPLTTTWQLQTQWINTIFTTHDLICSCDDVLRHFLQATLERGCQFDLDYKTKRIIQKCLTSTKDTGKTTTDAALENGIDDLTGEELEKLFAQPEETG
uniref:ORF2 n=1 Tax=Anellovirus D_HF6_591 TaxID=3071192 RepID=A0AA50KJ54_9VIRU|nr:ORF2 [Anellovirus D_HF6_591]